MTPDSDSHAPNIAPKPPEDTVQVRYFPLGPIMRGDDGWGTPKMRMLFWLTFCFLLQVGSYGIFTASPDGPFAMLVNEASRYTTIWPLLVFSAFILPTLIFVGMVAPTAPFYRAAAFGLIASIIMVPFTAALITLHTMHQNYIMYGTSSLFLRR